MRALVLGGSVFVGRRLVAALCLQGHDVAVLNRGRTRAAPPAGVEHLVADRTDPVSMGHALGTRSWDAVFDVSGFVMAAGGGDIVALLERLDGRTDAYLFVSSIMAYDQSMIGPVDSPAVRWTEDLATNGAGPGSYGGFKAIAEEAVFARFRATGFPATVVRPAAIYGPHNNIFDMETPMFLRLRRRLPILLPHAGLVTGSYGHVDDLCDLLIVAATSGAATGHAVNATGGEVSARAYVDTLASVVGEAPDIVDVPADWIPDTDAPLWSHLFDPRHHAVLDTTRATVLLGDRARFDLNTGHAQTYRWFLERDGAALDGPAVDPVWGATWDFGAEAAAAAELR